MTNLSQFEPGQPIAVQYFRQALNSHTLAHAYVLKGQPWGEMYRLAMEIARILNCSEKETPDTACGHCQNCKWIADNAHPAVITLSRLTYRQNEQGRDMTPEEMAKKAGASTNIKVDQINRLIGQLNMSSPYYRVTVFTDVEETANEPSGVVAPAEWRNVPGNEEKQLHIRPMNRQVFKAEAANRFLKTLEEPPPRSLFFFITDREESLIETIVSRCQMIPFLYHPEQARQDFSEPQRRMFAQLMQSLAQRQDVFEVMDTFGAYFLEECGLTPIQALDLFQRYLQQELPHQDFSPQGFARYRRWQTLLEEAKSQLQSKTNETHSLSNLFFQMAGAT
jgi:hypothetical protein